MTILLRQLISVQCCSELPLQCLAQPCAGGALDKAASFLARGDHPNALRNAPRIQGQMKIFHVGSHQFRESLRELLREIWFHIAQCYSENGISHSENHFFIQRAAPRIPRNSARAPRMAFHSESVFFSEVGVVPRLLIIEAQVDRSQGVSHEILGVDLG